MADSLRFARYPQADLAGSWGVSFDGTVYNFSLRDDVFWHDGEIFDSSDVLFPLIS